MTDAERYEQRLPGWKQPLYPIAFDPWDREKALVRLVFPDGTTIDLTPAQAGFRHWLNKATKG